MTKQRECTICKHYGKKAGSPEHIERASLYDESGEAVPVNLCRSHSVQLFQRGQKKFLLSHYKILATVVNTDEPKFLELLRVAARNNPDLIK